MHKLGCFKKRLTVCGLFFVFLSCANPTIYNRTQINFTSSQIDRYYPIENRVCFLPLLIKPLILFPDPKTEVPFETTFFTNYQDVRILKTEKVLKKLKRAGVERFYIKLCNEYLKTGKLDQEALHRLKGHWPVNYAIITQLTDKYVMKNFGKIYKKKIGVRGGIIDLEEGNFVWKFRSASASLSSFHLALASTEALLKNIWVSVSGRLPRDPKQTLMVPAKRDW